MATLFQTSSSPLWTFKNNPSFSVSITKNSYTKCPSLLLSHRSKLNSIRHLNFSSKDEEYNEPSSSNSSATVFLEETTKAESSSEELDLKTDNEKEKKLRGKSLSWWEVKFLEHFLGYNITVKKFKNGVDVDDVSVKESDRKNVEELCKLELRNLLEKIAAQNVKEELDFKGFLAETKNALGKIKEILKKEFEEPTSSLGTYQELKKLRNKINKAAIDFEIADMEKTIDDYNDLEMDLVIPSDSIVDTFKAVVNARRRSNILSEKKRVKRKNEFEKKLLQELTDGLEQIIGTTPPVDPLCKFEYEILEKEITSLKKSVVPSKALDLKMIQRCFSNDTFFVTNVGRFGDEGILVGRLMKPIEEILPELEKKISKEVGMEVLLSFAEEESNGITNQICMVQPKTRMEHEYEFKELSQPSALVLCASGYWILSSMGGFIVKPDATFGYYLANMVPLFGGLLSVWGVSTIVTRTTAASYGVKLNIPFLSSPKFLSQLPNMKALFDISFTQIASAYVTSFLLTVAASINDSSLSRSGLALYVKPQFFENNPLLSLIPFVLGLRFNYPWYSLPYAVEELQVPVNPLALAGLLGIVVTSLKLLPVGRFEGRRIARAIFGIYVAELLTRGTELLLAIGALSGSVVCTALVIYTTIASEKEMPAKDEITQLGNDRLQWGLLLAVIGFFTLFPNNTLSFPSLPFSSGAL